MTSSRSAWVCTAILLAAPISGGSAEPSSSLYRLVGSGPAGVAASTASPLYAAQLAGGSGAPVGIAASVNASVLAGPVSATLPTDRLFQGRFED